MRIFNFYKMVTFVHIQNTRTVAMAIQLTQTTIFNNVQSKKMPFFTNKFSPKRISARKIDTNVVSREIGPEFASRELTLDIPPTKLIIAKHEFLFEDGQWVLLSKSPVPPQKDDAKSQKLLETNEENNLLKLKFKVVLDMLTQTTVESQLRLKELEQMKIGIKKRKLR